MSSIHYKFRSSTEYDTIAFDGQAISLSDLREAIMLQKKIIKSPAYTLEITNAQTKEVYEDDNAMVPKNSSVIIKRVPVQRLAAVTDGAGLSKEEEELTEMAFAKLTTTPNLANAIASEDDKIKAMIKQSTGDFDPSAYQKRAPPSYICHRCGEKGHYLRQCPTMGDPRFNKNTFQRAPSGIPREYFLLKMKQEEEIINSLRASQDKNSRFSPAVGSDLVDHAKVPENLQCSMCRKLFTDAVVTPCCGDSYCDECIRNYLIEHDLTCQCGETTSPDNLIANKSLRITVDNFRNKKKVNMKSVPPSPVGQPHTSVIAGQASQKSQSVGQVSLSTSQPTPTISTVNGPNSHIQENHCSPQSVPSVDIYDVPARQRPPELHNESSQSSLSNGGLLYTNVPSPQVPDLMNSPQKPHLEKDNIQQLHTSLQPFAAQQLFPDTQHLMVASNLPPIIPSQAYSIGSQGLLGSHHQAIYSQTYHSAPVPSSNYGMNQPMMSQQIFGPGAIQYGLNLPTGATIVKRFVPVPVGPRLVPHGLSQQPIYGTNNMPMDLPRRSHSERSRKEKKLESPLPMSEDEFYSIQNKLFKKKPRYKDDRSRSPSLDKRSRHKHSLSPDRRHESDESSQSQSRRKDKQKRRPRDSSQEGSRSDSSKKRSDKKYMNSKKSRHLPKHIKRELEEFEFDNELEFDEELRKLRKSSKSKDLEGDEDLFSPKSKSGSTPPSLPLKPEQKSLSKSPLQVSSLPDEKSSVGTSNSTPVNVGDENLVEILPTTEPAENDDDVKPKKKTRIVKKVVKRVIKVKRSQLASQKSSETTTPTKSETASAVSESTDPTLGKIENEVAPENTVSNEIRDEETEQKTEEAEVLLSKESGDTDVGTGGTGDDDSREQEHEETQSTQSRTTVNEEDLPENSRWENNLAKRKTVEIPGSTIPLKKVKSNSDLEKNKLEIIQPQVILKKQDEKEGSKPEEKPSKALVEGKRDSYKRAMLAIEKAKKTIEREKANAKTDEEMDRVRRKEKYLLSKERQIKEKHRQRLRKERQMESLKIHTRKLHSDERESKRSKSHRSKEESSQGDSDMKSKKTDQDGESKLKSISERSKKTLKENEPCKPTAYGDACEGDVLKSKITSIRRVITSTDKPSRRVKITPSSDDGDVRPSSDDRPSRRYANDEKRQSSRTHEKGKDISRSRDRVGSDERWRREKDLERERQEAIERERERKRQFHEKELERDRLKRIERKHLRAEMERKESYEREKQAIRDKERLERKLAHERQLCEELMREKEAEKEKRKRRDESQKTRKVSINQEKERSRADTGSIINIVTESEGDSESSGEEIEKKKKKRSKKKKERKKKRKQSDDSDEDEDEDEESEDSSTEERKSKKKKKKHRKKHRKKTSRKSGRKHRKKSKKKTRRKDKSESEAEDEDTEENKDEDGDEKEGEDEEEDEEEATADDSSSDGESEQSATDQKEGSNDTNEDQSPKTKRESSTKSSVKPRRKKSPDCPSIDDGDGRNTEKREKAPTLLSESESPKNIKTEDVTNFDVKSNDGIVYKKNPALAKSVSAGILKVEAGVKRKIVDDGTSDNFEEKEEKKVYEKKSKTKGSTHEGEDEELDYNEDLGDIDDDVLYGDLNFADDEQINKRHSNKEGIKETYAGCEDGEISDELFTTNKKRTSVAMEPNKLSNGNDHAIELEIENAVDDAINELFDKNVDNGSSPTESSQFEIDNS